MKQLILNLIQKEIANEEGLRQLSEFGSDDFKKHTYCGLALLALAEKINNVKEAK